MADPNWFYSSLAQCAAAVVGLVGALLLSRLQALHEGVALARTRCAQSFRGCLRFAEEQRIHALNYAAHGPQELERLQEEVRLGRDSHHVERLYSLSGVAHSGIMHLRATPENIAREQRQIDSLPILQEYYREVLSVTTVTHARHLLQKAELLLEDLHDEPREALEPLGAMIFALLEDVDALTARAPLRFPVLVLSALVWLALFGVLVPLGFLTAREGLSKLGLLLAFGIGLAALLAFLGMQIRGIADLRTVEDLEDWRTQREEA